MRDITLEDTFRHQFTTRQFSDGVPTTLAGTPVLSVLEENNAVPITAGVSLSVDRASVGGLNEATIVATAANGYESGKTYSIYISIGTVGGTSVVGEVVGQFTIQASAAAVDLANGTDGLGEIKTVVDGIPTTAMRGTDSAALASVATEARLAELDPANLPADVDAILAAIATTGVAISATTANEIADALLKRDWTLVTGEAARSALNALRFLRNKWTIVGTTLTITEEDDIATAWTGVVSTDAAADPVTGTDPA